MAAAFQMFSDGGGDKATAAAGAAILTGAECRHQVVVYLGGATNNEAEISGGLVGFALLRAVAGTQTASVHWVCDSEYVLKSATGYINTWQRNGWKTASKQPVKNRALWEAYLQLAKGLRITPEHVRGHSGHTENEACDQACTWARTHGADYLAMNGPGLIDDSVGSLDEFGWILIDGRSFIETLRDSDDDPELVHATELIESIAPLLDAASGRVRPQGGASNVLQVRPILQSLEQAASGLQRLVKSDEKWNSVQKDLVGLIAKIKKMR